jgi:hypothetical protein
MTRQVTQYLAKLGDSVYMVSNNLGPGTTKVGETRLGTRLPGKAGYMAPGKVGAMVTSKSVGKASAWYLAKLGTKYMSTCQGWYKVPGKAVWVHGTWQGWVKGP